MFTHLHVHSHYSVLDGMSKVPDIVDKCLQYGMPAVALTDHGNMYGIKELLDYCKSVNKKRKEQAETAGTEYVPFKPIVGTEAYCARRGRHFMTDIKATNGEGKQYLVDRSGWHLILLAKNMQGYRNLCKLVSAGFMDDAFNYTARIDRELLEQYHEGIICSSACLGGELPQKIMYGLNKPATVSDEERFCEAEETISFFHKLFGDDYYIELQRHKTDKPGGDQETYQRQKEVIPVLVALAHKHNIKLIATNDAHFVNEENAEAHDRLICLSTNHFIDDEDRMHYTKQEWLKTPDEMAAVFSDMPEALANTQEIVDKVEIYDIDSAPIMPKFPIPEDFGTEESYHAKFTEQELFDEFTRDEHGNVVLSQQKAEEKIKKLGGYDRLYRIKLEADYLAHLTYIGAHERYGDTLTEEQEERIKFELHVMKTMGFPGYFLIVMDFIRAAREELGVSVGPGRGSAAGSVVAYCLHITDLNPLEYDLLFERFLNPDRISLPDIDTDFDDAGRGKVLDWVSHKYGQTHVAHIVTYGKMAAKSAIADVGRVQRIPLERVNKIKAMIPDRGFPDSVKDENGKSPKLNLRNCYKYVDDLRQLVNGDEPEIRSMLDYAAQLEDTIRQVGVHACGVIIGADDLTNFAPLSSIEDKELKQRVLVTEYDGHVIETVGLIKMDFLGLITLSIIKECLRTIRKVRGEEVDIDHIPIDDAETYKLFQEGRTIAVFQFESAGMRKYMRQLKPTVIGDLIAMNALYRPGPMDYIPQFINRKQGLEPVSYDLPCMEKYLKDTYGVTVYQEQVMLLSRLLANFTRGESDKLRKAMGKKQMDTLQELKDKFMSGGKANGHDPKILDKIWHDWEKFASYAFNKSHAACYSWVAYQTAYLKAHYPAEFMAANLTVSKDDIKDVTKLMDECKAMHIRVLEPDVNESDLTFAVNAQGDIRFGLGGIKGVGEGAVEALVAERERNGKYIDLFDFFERINLTACNRKTIECLAQAGAFDCFPDYYREQLFGVNSHGENVLDTLIRYGTRFQQDKQMQQNSLFGDLGLAVAIQHPEMPKTPRWTTIERLNIEKSLIGIYLSAHPLDEWEFELNHLCTMTAHELQSFDVIRNAEDRAKLPSADSQQPSTSSPSSTAAFDDDEANANANANTEEDDTQANATIEDAVAWLTQHENHPFSFGGLITEATQATTRDGNKTFGRYIIEDYTGSYTFVLFDEAYKNFAPSLQPNAFVFITAVVQQKGYGRSYYRPKPIQEADFRLEIQDVKSMSAAQSGLEYITLHLPVENIEPAFIDNLAEQTEKHKGNTMLKMKVYDDIRKHVITFMAQSHGVKIDHQFYHWLKEQVADNILTLTVNS